MIWAIRFFCFFAVAFFIWNGDHFFRLGLANSGTHRWMSLGLAFNAFVSTVVAIWIGTTERR